MSCPISSKPGLPEWRLVRHQARKHHVVAPLAVDFEITAQMTFPLKTGLFEKPHATLVIRNTGCLDTVQLKSGKDVGYNYLKCGEHMAFSRMALAHPVADHAALGGSAPDIADRQPTQQCSAILIEHEERHGLARIVLL